MKRLLCLLAAAALAVGCAHGDGARAGAPLILRAHLSAFPPITIAYRPVTLRAWVDDPESIFPCPSVTWHWPNGTRSSRSSDCAAGEAETRHSGGVHVVSLPSGSWSFRVSFDSGGREISAATTVEVR